MASPPTNEVGWNSIISHPAYFVNRKITQKFSVKNPKNCIILPIAFFLYSVIIIIVKRWRKDLPKWKNKNLKNSNLLLTNFWNDNIIKV